ncbi:TIM barrel protein [Nonomuraea cavernae]|uniref:Inosose dehydratase n=1 Tax=Nonomuraea cavernae TaxID=2045107 RepID=A0A917YYJ6_9ACTN|nr:TIM barrel protein [Nonomuraea cavernae]MCA2190503.1 TIM barrel protein [Nonomuraea cavernae]GGO70532.1 inosose dehydratase [Nonomuraea cavernae]
MRVTSVANAPVSFGVFELSDGPPPLTADEMVRAIADAGYAGIDLGPVGYLGTGDALVERLDGLLLAGGWADLPYHDPGAFRERLPTLDATLDVFAAAPAAPEHLAPRPTLGCSGSPARFARPGGNAPGLEAGEWAGYAARVQEAADRCRERGFEPAFHHHLGTYVETPDEVERLLELTDVPLCLDTGHLLVAGGDPVTALRDWASRIGHVHIKDGDRSILAQALADGVDLRELMGRGGFASLGEGELDLPGVVRALDEIGYQGWVIVEQDTLPGRRSVEQNIADQVANREKLRELGL